jgi:mannose-1-phosphate guanylyltransferase/MurNAc alpha-1-phosphate uridylyltransferase
MPWSSVAPLGPEPSGLYETTWAGARLAGRLDLVVHDGPFIDCGTVADYLRANLAWSGGSNVVADDVRLAPGASVVRSVLWPGTEVGPGERLVDAVRAGSLTVLVR